MVNSDIEQQLKEQEDDLVGILMKSGAIPEKDARAAARKIIDSSGSTKVLRGECPIGGVTPMACMFCFYGHMTECHYPNTCEQANCNHYQRDKEV